MNTQELKSQAASTTQTHTDIFIHRSFEIPLDTFWKAWTNAEMIKKWWGPRNFSCPAYHIDLRVGGKYLAGMKDKTKGKTVWSTGNYIVISPERKLVMTDSFSDEQGNWLSAAKYGLPGKWPKYLIISVEVKGNHAKTDMIFKQGPMPVETADDCIKGWQESFDKLEEEV